MISTKMTLDKLRAMKPARRRAFFSKASTDDIYAFTVRCTGEAHTNPYIDHCMCCINVVWGRMLKQDDES